jgi:hypothetical protein
VFPTLGFCLQALAHHFEGFLEELSRPYHLLQVGMISRGRVRLVIQYFSDLEG